ncbi:hypothetical protein IE53DRAFT_368207 [Violaceomyces palustris]|uniref:Uncharacterized protein n=1 Tax=Violaceomyces palustris TaxID=1673888 RepID=A0ACD0NZT4_9BASI|nr:hypothetical protein IE53DRAFT_368207 [Violaceomyces palustris]
MSGNSNISLTHAFTLRLDLSPPISVGPTPSGNLSFISFRGGSISGSGIEADILPGGGDYAIMTDDGYAKLDVRAHARTSKGDLIYLTYPGRFQLSPGALKVLSAAPDAEPLEFGSTYLINTPVIETGSKDHAWVNHTCFIGKGRAEPSKDGPVVIYEIYKAE